MWARLASSRRRALFSLAQDRRGNDCVFLASRKEEVLKSTSSSSSSSSSSSPTVLSPRTRALVSSSSSSSKESDEGANAKNNNGAFFRYQKLFEYEKPRETPWKRITSDFVSVVKYGPEKKTFLKIEPEALRVLSETAMIDIAHLLRPGHLQQLRNILDDSEASKNDKFVALELLKNACVAAGKVLPGCQDAGPLLSPGIEIWGC